MAFKLTAQVNRSPPNTIWGGAVVRYVSVMGNLREHHDIAMFSEISPSHVIPTIKIHRECIKYFLYFTKIWPEWRILLSLDEDEDWHWQMVL